MKKNVYIIAGPNGSGKTTFAGLFLPEYANCLNFVNADLIALGLAPFEPRSAAIKAGRLVLQQIHFSFCSFQAPSWQFSVLKTESERAGIMFRMRMPLQDKAEAAMKKAIRQVVERHKKTGRTLAVWENGKVVRISPYSVR